MLWGIDLGGTKVEGVVLHPDSLDVVFRDRLPSKAEEGYEAILDQIQGLLALMGEHSERPARIGMGTPGISHPDSRLMLNCNSTALNERPLQSDLEARFQCEFMLANDANCFALAEAQLGAGKGFRTVFGVILGTGVGGGLVVNGHLVSGRHGIAGEWGHNFLPGFNEPCYCGRSGCIETVISGPALERRYVSMTGRSFTLKEIAGALESDSDAASVIDFLVQQFGRAIAPVINIIDPDIIILGGGVGNIAALQDQALASASPHIFIDQPNTKFVRPHLGDSAGVFGAALLTQKS